MNEVRRILDRLRALGQGKGRKIFFFALGALGLVVFALNSIDSSGPTSAKSSIQRPSRTQEPPVLPQIFVHVVGSVKAPGIYRLPSSSRVFDAVFAAGGLLRNADQSSANFARILSDGEQIVILNENGSVGSASSSGSGNGATFQGYSSAPKINLNQADQTLLETLPGVGPTIAGRILDFRRVNVSFHSVSDLRKVSGIGVKLFAKISGLVTV